MIATTLGTDSWYQKGSGLQKRSKSSIFNFICSMKYELIIFDCDGTLVDSEGISNGIVADLINKAGVKMSRKEAVDRFKGTNFKVITDYIEEQIGRKMPYDFESEFRQLSHEAFEKELQPIPGVIDFLEALPIPCCVASNGPQIKMEVTLGVTGLHKYFDMSNTFSAYDLKKWKPEPHLFQYSALAMDVPEEKCLVIEDTIPGAMGAINANMDLFVYAPHDQKAFIEKDMPVFDQFSWLRKHLGF